MFASYLVQDIPESVVYQPTILIFRNFLLKTRIPKRGLLLILAVWVCLGSVAAGGPAWGL